MKKLKFTGVVPTTTKEVRKWCLHFFRNDPQVAMSLSAGSIGYGETFDDIVRIVTPFLKLLAYKEQLRFEYYNLHDEFEKIDAKLAKGLAVGVKKCRNSK